MRGADRPAISIESAATVLGVSVDFIENLFQRGVVGATFKDGERQVDSVRIDQLRRIQIVLRDLDDEGNPTAEELTALYR